MVYQLGDGSLLAATREVLETSIKEDSLAWKGHKSITTEVNQLQALKELPSAIEAPIYNF